MFKSIFVKPTTVESSLARIGSYWPHDFAEEQNNCLCTVMFFWSIYSNFVLTSFLSASFKV